MSPLDPGDFAYNDEQAYAAEHALPEDEQPWEPGEVDLTQLARYLTMLLADPDLAHTSGHAVLGAWTELLLAPDDATALAYARRLSDSDTRVIAHVPTF